MRLSRRHVLVGAAGLAACKTDPVDKIPSGTNTSTGTNERGADHIFAAQRTMDGAGVKLNRALGGSALGMLDPFLLLDEFQTDDPNDYIAGFPDHPHRGFETVTYMINGAMEHKDSVGNRGRLGPGSAQWMTAGRGIVHSEMPKQERGLMWGFQLWVNLPRARKMIAPRYQDIAPDRIPEREKDGARIRVVAGTHDGIAGPVTHIDVDPLFLDVVLTRGATFRTPIPSGHSAFVYVTDGAVRLGPARTEARRGQLAVLGRGRASVAPATSTTNDFITAHCDASSARVLLLAARPLGEPVARRGPFVMSTDDEIDKAWEDYRSGRLVSGG
jgi:quercetin 2,3-dioxygenase